MVHYPVYLLNRLSKQVSCFQTWKSLSNAKDALSELLFAHRLQCNRVPRNTASVSPKLKRVEI